eukprot:TRINITY_DN2912_c0_g1_i2.p1 TRINITY_DN2912_c0_g1~~TRINITY_DN2912_c0_g1_i2.p1  ORF type:complete len:273 (-),score=70.21 TRINITY_DN2912_c0_g1_i2:957-1775(-)
MLHHLVNTFGGSVDEDDDDNDDWQFYRYSPEEREQKQKERQLRLQERALQRARRGIAPSLALRHGVEGSRISHSHAEQFTFVRQSLLLWREIQQRMYKLWILADKDLLSETHPYQLCNTGQGLNRVQCAPLIGSEMHSILASVQCSVGGWLGLSVVHLGDQDVPNALVFIDKYTQVPRILGPIAIAVERLDILARQERTKRLVEEAGGVEAVKATILADFFRHGFDGSGSDGGSCIDGRLTSAWNWCSLLEKKNFYPLFLATGFSGFDGEFR